MRFVNNQQKGVALVVVLLIVALISILATQMAGRLQLNVVRAQNIQENNQAYWYALGAEEFARSSLATLSRLSGDNINLSQPWAQVFEYPVPGGSIKAQLFDMQSCFNLNAINSEFDPNGGGDGGSGGNGGTNQEAEDNQSSVAVEQQARNQTATNNGRSASQQAFYNLAELLISDSFTIDTLTDSLIDWIDADDNPSNYGAEDIDYESLPSPYLAANGLMSSKSELRLVNGAEEGLKNQWLARMLPLVCVLPETELKLNVNTVTEENAHVLAALLGDTLDSAQAIISNRPEEGYRDLEAFTRLPAVSALELQQEQIEWFALSTKYFKLSTVATFYDAQFRLTTLFIVENGEVSVIRREFGGF